MSCLVNWLILMRARWLLWGAKRDIKEARRAIDLYEAFMDRADARTALAKRLKEQLKRR
ncbi:hypothetical protein OPKNFCMD_6838 [Methylobacterium crusticola]|uniref:Uncharacterized protein n=1 Tax=Methylobacterium crusticola TaxID=1697972 RepID=A0ABQ4R8I8_9HYPH|nr:hypothetical protein OPKNFCMD_6838 [Methylobacterium crusticola]